MNNKKALGILITFFFLAAPAYAKPNQPPEHQITADDIVAKMTTQLQLTDKQAAEVKPIIENYLAQQKQLMLQEKKQLSRVLTGGQMFTWNFLQEEKQKEKKKHSL